MLTLRAAGDGVYPEAGEYGETMRVSYSSTHQGTTNIDLAVVPLWK